MLSTISMPKIMKEKTIHQPYLSRAKDLEISRGIAFIISSHQHKIRYTKEHGKKIKIFETSGKPTDTF